MHSADNSTRQKPWSQTAKLILVLAALAPTAVQAAEPVTPHDRAGDAAVQALIGSLMELRLADGRTVSMLLGAHPEAECDLRARIIADHQQSRARALAGHAIEVEAWMEFDRFAQVLRDVADGKLPDAGPEQLTPVTPTDRIALATGRIRHDGLERADQPGWRHCEPWQLQAAEQGARLDLRMRLARKIGALQLPGPRSVGELMRRNPRFSRHVRERLGEIEFSPATFDRLGLCRVTTRLGRADLIELLARAAAESGDPVRADFTRIVQTQLDQVLIVTGYGLAPPDRPRSATMQYRLEPALPDWVGRILTARASGKAPAVAGDQAARRRLAIRAARIEAIRQLWLEIEDLPIDDTHRIGDLDPRQPAVLEALQSIDDAIGEVNEPVFGEDGTATVAVGVPLVTVWRAIRELPAPSTPSPTTTAPEE